MKITGVQSWLESFELKRPYSISFKHFSSVNNVVVMIETDSGMVGLGSGAPFGELTGESLEDCYDAVNEENLAIFLGGDPRQRSRLFQDFVRRVEPGPAAMAAVDIALYDLFAQAIGLPLVDVFGRSHDGLPTSITVGIMSTERALTEVDEYLGLGFTHLKIKIGQSLEDDIERVSRIREHVGPAIGIRVDANQGYSTGQLSVFMQATERLGIELIEQPLPVDLTPAMRDLPMALRHNIAADEALLTATDALNLLIPERAYGIYNIKLMKCGGLTSAIRIATIAAAAGIDLMWGCMDESAISISAALHLALASPATRYLDLDGSLDLATDLVDGGFVIKNGVMYTSENPGLGVSYRNHVGK